MEYLITLLHIVNDPESPSKLDTLSIKNILTTSGAAGTGRNHCGLRGDHNW